jgi:glycosyltransferase involved in cell wall biosynthesis
MKILHIIASVDPRGGGPIEGVFSSSRVWLQNGHERHIVCLDPPDAPWVGLAPVTTFALGIGGRWYSSARRLFPALRYGYSPHLVPWLRRFAGNYDAVVINGLWNYASFGAWRALRGGKVPYFVFTHGMLDPWFNQAYPFKTRLKSIFWKLFEHRVLRDAHGVLFTCEEERQLAATSFAPYSAKEYVVGYGTNDVSGDDEVQRTAFYDHLPAARGRKLILFLSRIHPKKGVDLLISAFARHAAQFPEFDLVIAGPDQSGWGTTLRQSIEALGLGERVHWPGMLAGDIKWGAFRSSTFFALPSHQENFGIVVAEAMAVGKPVLITNIVNIWREIQGDRAGLVVDDTLESISLGICLMCKMPPIQLSEMGANGRACFLQRYDLKENAMHLLTLLDGIINSPSIRKL